MNARIVVADGGSTDATRDIVARISAADPRDRAAAQSAADPECRRQSRRQTFGRDYDYLIRIDAHGDYPADYCRTPGPGGRC